MVSGTGRAPPHIATHRALHAVPRGSLLLCPLELEGRRANATQVVSLCGQQPEWSLGTQCGYPGLKSSKSDLFRQSKSRTIGENAGNLGPE